MTVRSNLTIFLQASTLVCLLLAPASVPAQEAAEEAPVVHTRGEVPFREDSGLTKAEYYLATEKYAEALSEIALVLKRHPHSADALAYRGYALAQMGEHAKARDSLKKALLASPAHLGANKYLANLYLAEGKLAEAIEQMQVIRMTCGETDCEELNELERDINAYKSGR